MTLTLSAELRLSHCGNNGAVTARWALVLDKTPSAKWAEIHKRPQDYIEVTSPRTALDLALAGHVRAALPTFIGDNIEGLAHVSPSMEELDHEQWLITHNEDRYLPAVRKVIDRMHLILSATSSRN